MKRLKRLLYAPMLLAGFGVASCDPLLLGSNKSRDDGGPGGPITTDTGLPGPPCPATLPPGGSSCPQDQLACVYPGGVNADGAWHQTALCQNPGSGLSWQIVTHTDRTACVYASGPGRSLSISDCATRVGQACGTAIAQTPQELLTSQINAVAQSCATPPNESHLEVDFTDGCPSKITLQFSGPLDGTAMYDCLAAALATHRYACAQGLECARLDPSTLP